MWGVSERMVKRAFKFRFYPSDAQAAELARTFGCVRKVYNLALAARTEAWTLRHDLNSIRDMPGLDDQRCRVNQRRRTTRSSNRGPFHNSI